MILTPEQKEIQRVVCAACIKGAIIICSPRHMDKTCHNLINAIDPDTTDWWYDSEQGFIDQFGNFLTRQEAWVIAARQNQIIRLVGNQTKEDLGKTTIKLYSENLY